MNEKIFNIDDFKIGQNMYIDASAGTGKTYTIQQLVSKLVKGDSENAPIPLSKILIVTFTEKATGELRDRIRQKMESCYASEKLDCYRTALQNIHTAPIFTIHSFCQKTLHDFAYEANAPLSLDVVSDDNIVNLIQKLIRDKWSYTIEFQNIFNKGLNLDLFITNFVNATKAFLQDHTTQSFIPKIESIDNIVQIEPNVKWAWETLNKYKDESQEEKLKTKTNVRKISDLIDAISEFDGKGKLFPSTFNKKWRGIWSTDELNKAVEILFETKDLDYQDDNLQPYQEFILKHIEDVIIRWEREKKQNKQQSFSNMIYAVHDIIMKGNGELVKKIRGTYRYAIIDEFQDTNQTQWDIFKKIFLEESKQNNIIVVGDPKQSIFSFQGANVKVYRNAIKEIANGNKLSTNNRSTNDIINACNAFFQGPFFDNSDFKPSLTPPKEREKKAPLLNGRRTEPLWISDFADETEFAEFAVKKIVECCSRNHSKPDETSLRIFDSDKKEMRNVKFSDIAVLARTRSEMTAMENAMAKAGIPYARYKDTNLFNGKECAHWISLLKAIDAPDFYSWNRKFLNEALMTDFFRISLQDVEADEFTDPKQKTMTIFLKWRSLSEKKRWAELQESIYQETEIDKYLSTPSTLQRLAKIRQIGAYIFDFLYNNRATLEQIIKHLQGISSDNEDIDDTDGNMVAKGSDFDSVNLMTIHASKGLAFPIAIITGGLRGDSNRKNREPYSFKSHEQTFIGFDHNTSKFRHNEEEHEEWRRLMYVAYTRAQSLMIVPRYKIWFNQNKENNVFEIKGNNPFAFLSKAIEDIRKTEFARTRHDSSYDSMKTRQLKNEVSEILHFNSDKPDNTQSPDFELLQNKIKQNGVYQYSYSSLANKKKALEIHHETPDDDFGKDVSVNGDRVNREENEIDTSAFSTTQRISIDNYDYVKKLCTNYNRSVVIANEATYPRGANLGDALHKVFEKTDFELFGTLSEDEAIKNANLRNLITATYAENSIHMQEHPEWTDLTAKFIWNTLNASLPEIHGSIATGEQFKLCSLASSERRAEMGFHLNVKEGVNLSQICKGFIDLMFVRKGCDGHDYFSILDWKSDIMPDVDYSDKEAIDKKIEDEYSIQRVLYSNALIQWLKQFYNESEEEIFQNHFGGIYYALVRGTKADSCNGIYAQTWNSYNDLRNSYNNIVSLMNQSQKNAL